MFHYRCSYKGVGRSELVKMVAIVTRQNNKAALCVKELLIEGGRR